MKKLLLGIIPVIMLAVACAGSAKPAESTSENSAVNSGLITLDQALNEAANRIDERITTGSKIAPLNFNSPHDKFSDYVLEELTANLVENRKLTVVDRREINLIRNEMDFQFSGEVADDSMQEIGRMLGAQSIISGNFTDMGGFIRIMIRVLNVQNASVEVQYRANIVSDTVTTALLTGGKTNTEVSSRQTASSGSSTVVQAPVTTSPVPQLTSQIPTVPATPAYSVGDTGPAGGLIFYDKGNYSNGWRYLEAAPTDIANVLYGAREDIQFQASERSVGSGKVNTQAIMREANNRGGGFGWAAQACDALEINGFADWYLPSRDELHFMYGNLHMRGLGNYRSEWYWSSTSYVFSSASHNGFWIENFSNGTQSNDPNLTLIYQDRQYRVRACRQF